MLTFSYTHTATADYSQNNVRTAAIPSVIPLTSTSQDINYSYNI